MTSKRTSNTVWDSVQVVATQLLRRPVKEAVREALREEATTVESVNQGRVERGGEGERPPGTATDSDGGGRSVFAWLGALAVIGGVAYLARRRMSSTTGSAWSEPSPGAVASEDAAGGYTSEGEMQTAETAGGSDGGAGETGNSS